MQASFLLEEATMEVLLLPLQRRDLCASALCCVGGDATEEEEGKMEQLTLEEASEEYKAFVDKFKPKLTTDDCYTPPNIYETVKEWVFEHYNLDKSTKVIRPFYPGGDYEHAEYPENSIVIDNPPFSILSKIEKFYLARGLRFFLFAPGTACFKPYNGLHCVCVGSQVTYHNGANVNTSFVTNLGGHLVETAPDLYRRIKTENEKNVKAQKKQLDKLKFPPQVVTAAQLNQLSAKGQYLTLDEKEVFFTRTLDNAKKGVFGSCFLLSEKAAAERAVAERAVNDETHYIELSEREKEIIKKLGVGEQTSD